MAAAVQTKEHRIYIALYTYTNSKFVLRIYRQKKIPILFGFEQVEQIKGITEN